MAKTWPKHNPWTLSDLHGSAMAIKVKSSQFSIWGSGLRGGHEGMNRVGKLQEYPHLQHDTWSFFNLFIDLFTYLASLNLITHQKKKKKKIKSQNKPPESIT